MKRIVITLSLFFGMLVAVMAQNSRADLLNNERDFLYVTTHENTKAEVNALSRDFSVDNCPFDERTGQYAVRIYLGRDEYNRFLDRNLPFEIIPAAEERPGMVATTLTEFMTNWNQYPSYPVYEEIMQYFQTNFPDICKIDTILAATPCTQRPHKLLAAHISTTLGQPADKPAFLYTSTMHGDEVVGYYMMIRLIDFILNNPSDPQVQNVLQNVDLYICPLENPDGTYKSSNTQISSSASSRYNWNNVDMNRNYPFLPGVSGSANVQPETQAYINFVSDKNFVMSVNFHGGAELTNFPWDVWRSSTRTHADDAWYRYICQNYVDQCQAVDPTYMVGETAYNPGCGAVTEGGDWYEITGSRQDYMNYYQHCREVTMEVHFDKVVTSNSELPTYWTNSKTALLNYVMECTYGFRGLVTDAVTGEPIDGAKVFVQNHDTFNSEVYSHFPLGAYYRPIKAGTYTVEVSADCYETQTFTITTTDGAGLRHDVQLQPLVSTPQVADQHINVGQTATLTAASNNTIMWYASATATSPIATGNSFTTPQLFETTTYYVEEQATDNNTTCVSERSSATVYVTEGVHDTVHGYDTIVACDSYTINGQTLTVSGCYLIMFPYAGQNYADSLLHLCLNLHHSVEVTVQQSYVVGETYYIGTTPHYAAAAGTYNYDQLLTSQFGCDSLVHYEIHVNTVPPTYADLSLSGCGSIFYEDETYTNSGDYTLVYPSAAANLGDSILTLHLTIYPEYEATNTMYVTIGNTYTIEGQTHTAAYIGTFTYECNHTTLHGCDSTIHYVVNVTPYTENNSELTIEACAPFTYEGEVLTMDGDYTFYYPGAGVGGTDSVLVIHLTLHPSYETTIEEHLELGEHFAIDDYDFYSEQSGIYYFDREYETAFGCDSILHYILSVGNVGIDEAANSTPTVAPNPATDQCHISGLQAGSMAEVRIFSTYGQLVRTAAVSREQSTLSLEGLNSGTYFIQIIESRGITTQKIIKL